MKPCDIGLWITLHLELFWVLVLKLLWRVFARTAPGKNRLFWLAAAVHIPSMPLNEPLTTLKSEPRENPDQSFRQAGILVSYFR